MKLKIFISGLVLLIFAINCKESVIESVTLELKTPQLKSATLSTNFYVSKTGNDSNAGTILFPFLTIQKGLNAATAAGDTVFVRAGIYAEYVTFNTSGATGNPIVLKNYGSDAVTIDATGSRYYGIYAHLINNIVVDGFTVINSTHYNVYISGCSNVTLQNINSQLPVVTSVIYNYLLNPSSTTWNTNINLINCNALNGGYGLYISGGNNGVMVTGGEFSYAYIDGVNIEGQGSDPSLYAQNIVINGAYSHHNGRQGLGTFGVNYVTFQNCHSAYNAASGIQIEANSSNTIVENNRCEFNCRGGGYANSGYETGIWVFNSSNSIVRRNITTGNQTGLRFGSVTNFQAYDNLIIGNNFHNPSASPDQNTSGVDFSASTGTFYNNTLVGNSASDSKLGSIYVYPASGSNIIIKNNIVVNDGSDTSLAGDMHFGQDGTSTVVSDYNLVYNANRAVDIRIVTTNHTWSDYKSLTGQDAHSIVADPLFVSTTNYQFQAASPAINAGVNVGLTSDFQGNPINGLPDIGAYEATTLSAPAITSYYNTEISATATKNSCGAGYTGSTVTYTVAAGKYSSTVSQAAADILAAADLNTNTQTYANANGTCTLIPVYYNTQISASATKNSCEAGYTGSTVNYTVAAGKYSSTISQVAADNLASADLNTNTQTYANANGNCTLIPVYYNTQISATATKNSCGAGYTGSTVNYTVAAGKYSSTISQVAADNLASTDLNTNTQTYANANGTCTLIPVYYNTQISATATKNSCGAGYTGSTVNYTVAAGKYSSTVSQAAADNLASTDLNTNTQTYANANGTCTLIPVYYNTQISATATKNSCGAGYTGSTVNYTVSAGKYSSTVSQAAVDNLASTDLNTNTQSYANANGTCTAIPVYYNTQASASATKNNCGTGYTGSTVTYTVAAGKYSSTVSQAAANTLATTDLNANTQTYANTNGTCTLVPVKVYYNVVMSATATKNNCGKGLIGSTVTYTIAAKTYSSTVSQTAANNLAITALRANKQAYANANGTCTSSKLLKIGH